MDVRILIAVLNYTSDDNVMSEARNLRNMVIAQTPLLGEENTPMHTGPAGGTGFEGATPRHQVAFTPNPLATPLRAGLPDPLATPRDVQATPSLQTPLRDGLKLNPEDGISTVGDTPREQRLRVTSTKRALQAGFMSLPKPENNFELLVPEEEAEEEVQDGKALTEEDAADRDARLKKLREEEERKTLARRSQVVQRGLPRPPNIDIERLLNDLTIGEDEDGELGEAQRLVHAELANLLQHDSIAHPIPGTSHPGGTVSTYEMPDDDVIAVAKSAIWTELATELGYPDANEETIKQGIATFSAHEEVDDTSSWARIRERLAFDPDSRVWVEPDQLSEDKQIAGLSVLLDECRDTMTKEAGAAAKLEKKLNKILGGYQARAAALSKRVTDAFSGIQKTKTEFDSFSRLRANETAVGPLRVAGLKEEVERLERREKLLQERYAEVDAERREASERVAALEERIMAEAEAMNEAALAAMEDS